MPLHGFHMILPGLDVDFVRMPLGPYAILRVILVSYQNFTIWTYHNNFVYVLLWQRYTPQSLFWKNLPENSYFTTIPIKLNQIQKSGRCMNEWPLYYYEVKGIKSVYTGVACSMLKREQLSFTDTARFFSCQPC